MDLKKALVGCAVAGVSLLAGAFLGVPGAFFNPQGYLDGYRVAQDFYLIEPGGPSGLHDASLWERVVYLAWYLIPTIGPVALLAVAGGVFAATQLSWRRGLIAFALLAPSIATIGYMGTRKLFIERNFSHALPLVFIVGAIGIVWLARRFSPRLRTAALTVLIVAALCPGLAILSVLRFDSLSGAPRRIDSGRAALLAKFPGLPNINWPDLSTFRTMPYLKAHVAQMRYPYIMEFVYYNDSLGRAVMDRFLADYHHEQIGVIEDPLKPISPSTMQTYFYGSRIFYKIDGPV